MTGALDGLRVIDVSEGVAGGYCTKLLAGFGADVVKVELPFRGDSLRRAGPFQADVPSIETSALHLHLNAGKRSVTLDWRCPSGRALLRRLVERADVLVVCDPPPEIHAGRAVVTQVTPFGAAGRRAAWRATEIVAGAAGGYLGMTGDPDREPVKPYGQIVGYYAGLQAALGTLAALAVRDRTGKKQTVDVSVAEAAAFLVGGALQRSAVTGRAIERNGARVVGFGDGYHYPSTVRPCRDGWVHAHSHNRFPELLGAFIQEPSLNAPELLADRLGHADTVDAALDRWLAERDRWTAVAEAQEVRLPFVEVLNPGEVVDDRLGQHRARGFFPEIEHPVVGAVRQPGPPVRMTRTPWRTARAPLLGEHNAAVYCGELGLEPRDLARLAAAGVL
ncbi:MAG: CoA transferase [Dehalococcoidia bacterium]